MKELRLFIDNAWKASEDGATFESTDPSTGEPIARLAAATRGDVDAAVRAARQAAPAWSEASGDERAGHLLKAAQIIRRRRSELALWEARDVGKPIAEAALAGGGDIDMAIRALEFFANLARHVEGNVVPLAGNTDFDYETYEPFGVVGVIVPWNFPIHIATRAVAPALAAGNTVVLKPSSLAPVTCALLGEVFLEAGVPPGVLNVLTGEGNVVGGAMSRHAGIDMISFTGSTEVGRTLLRASAESNLKKVILELGGKGAFIAESDCRIEDAVDCLVMGFCYNQGEVCSAQSRLYLHEAIYDDFLGRLLDRCRDRRLGDILDPATQMGSLINGAHLQKVQAHVDEAARSGAKLLCGGRRAGTPACEKGSYYLPTVLEVHANSMKCVQEEIFGPVLVVRKYDALEQAIQLANDSDYALGSSIWSEDVGKLWETSRRLNAGIVWMNAIPGSKIEASYGGNKLSGFGREGGRAGLMEYLRCKNNVLGTRRLGAKSE